MATGEIYVYADWREVDGPRLMGILGAVHVRGKEVFSFGYNQEWLGSGFAQILDPDLRLYSGRQFPGDQKKTNFGLFLDSSPDRWGRVLMQRREAAQARQEKRTAKKLFETDYLLGVHDGQRIGGLRFKTDPEGPFLDDNKESAIPPWTSLRELEKISLRLEEPDIVDDPEYMNWLKMLVTPGSSLGGARPKAGVLDPGGHLWIAKFPSTHDQADTGAWEMVACKLALVAGINMSECQLQKYSGKHHTFLTKRFDRTNDGKRIHFTSAMTQLGYVDHMDASAGVSYLELVEFIQANGARVKDDLHELWRRIVFSICVSNTDDHLRNHGFLLTNEGWVLSPAYDINPSETGTGLKLNISEDDNSLDLELAMEVHEYFRLKKNEAIAIMKAVRSSVQNWREIATGFGISRAEQEIKAAAFSQGIR